MVIYILKPLIKSNIKLTTKQFATDMLLLNFSGSVRSTEALEMIDQSYVSPEEHSVRPAFNCASNAKAWAVGCSPARREHQLPRRGKIVCVHV